MTLSANTSWYLYNFRASTIGRLLAEGYRVVCLSPEDDYSARLPELGCEWQPIRMDNQGSNPIKDIGLVVQFWRHYRRLRPVAALHFTIKNNVYGTWAARILGIPVINNVSGLGTAFIRTGPVAWIVRLLYKTSQPLAQRVFCQNAEDMQLLINNNLVPNDRLVLLPGSGVNLERFNPVIRQANHGPFRFLYAGRMLADKGLHELVEAITQLHLGGEKAVLWLCGFAGVSNVSAITESQLESWANEPFIEWLGPTDAMEEVLAQVDCVVLPSYREGLPRSLLEAGAMGLPSVATDVPGCRHVITDGENGFLCEARSVESLVQALTKMLHLPVHEREAMGGAARKNVEENFSEQVVVDATLKAIREVSKH
ncbi:glycosyltransferase family 4 protein [Parahaliea sp. F7430]|uniref:Glycosyltransferase family 4 protein n=1 Tax=Sediminihaliea albiluteola TaxID=2758564 RepID=A0A7W2YI98_9GAMM|nr:glycosyltransferase family 4 protein [Sediminihaliea albiluteola]